MGILQGGEGLRKCIRDRHIVGGGYIEGGAGIVRLVAQRQCGMDVLMIVVVVAPPGHGACCASAGAKVCVAWISRVAAVVVVLFCVRASEFGLVEDAVVAGAVDAGTANGAVWHVWFQVVSGSRLLKIGSRSDCSCLLF